MPPQDHPAAAFYGFSHGRNRWFNNHSTNYTCDTFTIHGFMISYSYKENMEVQK